MMESVASVAVQSSQTEDIATRLLSGSLHAGYPPVEQFLTIDGLLRSHAAQPDAAKQPLICYPVRGADDYEEHTAADIDRYVDIAVHYYMKQGLMPAVRQVWHDVLITTDGLYRIPALTEPR